MTRTTDLTEAQRTAKAIEANRRYQQDWRKRHFALHKELVALFKQMDDAIPLIEHDNKPLANRIRKALKEIEGD